MTNHFERAAVLADVRPNLVLQAPLAADTERNGHTRPAHGSKTGLVWDIADAILADSGRPPKKNRALMDYLEAVGIEGSPATFGTQFSRWHQYHGIERAGK